MNNTNDPRSDEHRFPEGDMNANPTRPFVVATDLSRYFVRETATGKSMTKRCTFDEADYACNLLNYGWRACQKRATEEMNSQLEVEARERGLLMKQITELEAMVYHTGPGQLEYSPEGWTWKQQSDSEMGRCAELEYECEAQSNRYAKLLGACRKLQSAWTPQHVVNTPFDLAAVEVMLATSDINAVGGNANVASADRHRPNGSTKP